ncbi:STAS domain-containing protein [Streptomyces sp. NBC_01497]|uniref:STAS domain-containing protein n=1 Tax=Streptomyces sp. NBC_01497 TaxID=2903885 RepID=UPI002E36771A|nr:STAS domain-containing protein [Streptomyces sp. NBC_01497]
MTSLALTTDETRGARIVVSIQGDLDMHAAGDLHNEAGDLLTTHPLMIMDLSGITFCDSSGYNALLRLRRRAGEAGGQLVLAAPPPTVSRLLALTGAEEVFDVYSSRAEALAAHPARDVA